MGISGRGASERDGGPMGGQVQRTAHQMAAAMRRGRVVLPSPCTSTTPAPWAQAGCPAWRTAWPRGPKGSGQMLLPCGCPSLSAAPCAITAGPPAHPPPGSAHCMYRRGSPWPPWPEYRLGLPWQAESGDSCCRPLPNLWQSTGLCPAQNCPLGISASHSGTAQGAGVGPPAPLYPPEYKLSRVLIYWE